MLKIKNTYDSLAAIFLKALPISLLETFSDELLRLRFRTQELIRQRLARNTSEPLPNIHAYDGDLISRSILEKHPPWDNVPAPDCAIPGMLTEKEKIYYSYITKFFSGSGCIVELGPWLGLSTYYLLSSLLLNPNFNGKKLHVYDDFIWRSSWINKWLDVTNIPFPLNHSSFISLFLEQMGNLTNYLIINQQKFCDLDGNQHLPIIKWGGEPIRLLHN